MLSKHPPYNPVPYQGKLTVANLITDVTRLAGVQGDGAAYPDSSVGVWPAATNIATQSIPGALATTGVTKAGDAAATLAKVADSTHPFPNATADVWCLDNSAGSTDATVDFDGNATAAAHAASIWAYKTAGSPNLSIEGAAATTISGATWAQYQSTATASLGNNLRVTAPAGAVVYFVAAQLETGSIATPFILTDGGTASRVAGRIQGPASVLDETQMWVLLRLAAGFPSTLAEDKYIFDWDDDASNRIFAFWDDAVLQWRFQRRNGSGAVTVTATNVGHAANDDLTIILQATARSLGIDISGGALVESTATQYAPSLAATTWDIGSAGTTLHSACRFRYAAMGKGTLTEGIRSTMKGWGNNRPLPHMFPQSADVSFLAHFYGDGTQYRWAA